MPIRPENKTRYPKHWPQIRAAILERAANCCEQCKAPNRTLVARGTGSDADTYMLMDGEVRCAMTGEKLGYARGSEYNTLSMTEIVLTIAHMDHTPEHCEPENLKALCQRCHLSYDKKHHAQTAHTTRRSRLAISDMFDKPSNARLDKPCKVSDGLPPDETP